MSQPLADASDRNGREEPYDVAIIGGGPSGSTLASLLLKYRSDLKVVILERERFPRDHIGESLLPPVSGVLHEMGCWDAVERANFPIKIGATYRWGRRPQLWDFDFIPPESFKQEPRPAKFEGLRKATAFQVDRAVYDTILLGHAASLGCEVRQATRVSKVLTDGDSVQAFALDTGEQIRARHFVDASGNSGILRRAMNIECDYPSTLKNIAIYDYWQNAEWAVEIGVGATRIQVRSLGYGWLWFIPLGPTRTSIGLVIPVDYFKKTGRSPAEVYAEALENEPTISVLLKHAASEGNLQTTRDWSFLARRQVGHNWYLVGESSGFADPILSAGVTMAHIGARKLAYTILELYRGELDADWLKQEFQRQQQQRIMTHIRFGDFWYTANKQLTDLKEFTSQLAADVGLGLSPESAWDWISRGGFISEDLTVGKGGFGLRSLRQSSDYLMEVSAESLLESNNILDLDLQGAEERSIASYEDGRVHATRCFFRDGRILPMKGAFIFLTKILMRDREFPRIMANLTEMAARRPNDRNLAHIISGEPLEAMIRDGWVRASYDPRLPLGKLNQTNEKSGFHWNEDLQNG